jgi:hypothetical protein
MNVLIIIVDLKKMIKSFINQFISDTFEGGCGIGRGLNRELVTDLLDRGFIGEGANREGAYGERLIGEGNMGREHALGGGFNRVDLLERGLIGEWA